LTVYPSLLMSLKILHVIPSIAPVRGGPSLAVLEMVLALRSQGMLAEIATTNDNGTTILEVPCNQSVEHPVQIEGSHTETVPVRFFKRQPAVGSALCEYSFAPGLTRWLWQSCQQYDLLHIHALFSYPSTAAMVIARMRRVPYVLRPIGQLCHWSLQQSQVKKKLYLALLERANLQRAQALHFTALQEQQEAAALRLIPPGFVIPHGTHLSPLIASAKQQLCQRLGILETEPVLLFLSRLHPKKGLDRLIAALALVKHLPFQFVMAGSGDPEYEHSLRQQIRQAGLTQRVHQVGFASGEFKQLLLQGADVFLLPSHSENFGVAVLEAMAAGLPVITSPQVALAKVVQTHQLGWICDNSVSALQTTLATVLRSHLNFQRKPRQGGNVLSRLCDRTLVGLP
jgi:glycosyltransferase involved in cell wall biosynthesis